MFGPTALEDRDPRGDEPLSCVPDDVASTGSTRQQEGVLPSCPAACAFAAFRIHADRLRRPRWDVKAGMTGIAGGLVPAKRLPTPGFHVGRRPSGRLPALSRTREPGGREGSSPCFRVWAGAFGNEPSPPPVLESARACPGFTLVSACLVSAVRPRSGRDCASQSDATAGRCALAYDKLLQPQQ